MSQATRQTTLFGIQDWQTFYQTFANVDLQSYDYETLRKSMVDYIRLNHPENFNDYINSSEFVALLDVIAFMGQSLSFRFDLNARESFLATAQSRDAIVNLAQQLNYQVQRNRASNGYLKINSISVNDDVQDSLGNNLNALTINWNDKSNSNWQDQWNSIINAVLMSSQTVGNPGNSNIINGITVAEYGIDLPTGTTTPFPFTTTVDGSSMNFEAVNPTSLGQTFIYEKDPSGNTIFNLLYKTDGLGFSSNNTGYFLYFKQGTLTPETFSIVESLPNRTVNLTTTGVNNDDVWLFQQNTTSPATLWTVVDAIYGENTIFNSLPTTVKTIYSITTRTQDAIGLTFGDGVFGTVPVGNFTCYQRVSNGLDYRINPSEMSSIQFSIPYTSKLNRTQILTVTASLLYTVANSSSRENLNDVKIKAPQSYYSQNRMVNGQDYNTLPFTKYNNIIKIKAINRTSSGVSRYLDVIDPTGKYSSTNIFCSDGYIYEDPSIVSTVYSYSTRDQLAGLIENQVVTSIFSAGLSSFFNENYPALQINTVNWNLVLTDNTSSSGYLTDSTSNLLVSTTDQRFAVSVNNSSSLINGAILVLVPPTGSVFDINNNLVTQQLNGNLLTNQKSVLYVAVQNIIINGTGNTVSANGINADGSGAIQLSQKIPTGAILQEIFPVFIPQLDNVSLTSIINNLSLGNSIALTFNPNNIGIQGSSYWNIDTTLPLNYNPAVFGTEFVLPTSTSATVENSWLVAFVPGTSTTNFTVYVRNINYYFGSDIQTSFYTGPESKIFDSTTGSIVFDTVTVLKTNSLPGSNTGLGFSQDITVNINGSVNNINGTLDTSRVSVKYSEINQPGTPDNPLFFTDVVGPFGNSYVFFVTDNVNSTTTILDIGDVSVVTASTDIDNNLYTYANGDIVFVTTNDSFYSISRIGSLATKSLLNNTGDQLTYNFFLGRQDLNFQYQHNAASNSRIDPSPSNIIDVYVLEQTYANDYQAWVTDNTGQVLEPIPPTTETLRNDFIELEQSRMISDLLIYNPVNFKPLFGAKADPELTANFVVVSQNGIVVGDGEIKSRLITAVNNYFAVGEFDFGETFYASQLMTYLHIQLSDVISSVHLVPLSGNQVYGDLQQIVCLPYEIFTTAATVDNVIVVTDLTNINLKIG